MTLPPPPPPPSKHASRFLVSGQERTLVKSPIILLTTESLNKKYFVILQQGECATDVSASSKGKNAQLKEINVNRDRSQVSSICKKKSRKGFDYLCTFVPFLYSPPPRLLEPMLLITWKFLRVMQNLGGMINNSNGQRCCCWESTTAMTSFCGWF